MADRARIRIALEVVEKMIAAERYDLSQPYFNGMPVWPGHPEFHLALMRRHGDVIRPSGGSSSNEIVIIGGHVGTHMDAPAHIAGVSGLLGDVDPKSVESNNGFAALGIDTFEPGAVRAIFLDVAAIKSLSELAADETVGAKELEAACDFNDVNVSPGDCVLIRTGMGAHWNDRRRFLGGEYGLPGVNESGAEWLVEHGVGVVGTDTICFESFRPGQQDLPVHELLLAGAGIFIMEALNLEALATHNVRRALIMLAPLHFQGATGSPIRPVAFPY